LSGGFEHITVLRDEVVATLRSAPAGIVVDCTLGGGGHSEAILRSRDDIRVIGIDRDPAAIAAATERLAGFGNRFVASEGSYSDIAQILREHDVGLISGIVADVGVSSHQIDLAERGFSFQKDGPLDMRMGPCVGATAADYVNNVDRQELCDALRAYGDVRSPWKVAGAIVDHRPYTTTLQLAGVISDALGGRRGRIHPATRSFQAIRIVVNDELGELESLLSMIPSLLSAGGVAAIISFHSAEDRMVKRSFFDMAGVGAERDPFGNPVVAPKARLLKRGALKGGGDNVRARSARLRSVEWL
jgi:16S rRNA (cytosine1402-N4)-methyltransferase